VVVAGFEWDDENVGHIERHQFTSDEEVFVSGYRVRRAGQGRYIALGKTLDGPPGGDKKAPERLSFFAGFPAVSSA
jgi:hypothetical protein